jgi:hypothetical protein
MRLAFLALFAALIFCAAADLQPIPVEKRLRLAGHIFSGSVTKLEFKDVGFDHFPGWTTRHYRLTVLVDNVTRTEAHAYQPNPIVDDNETVAVSDSVHVMTWKAMERTPGFTGDTGISVTPEEGRRYLFFTHYLHRSPQRRSMYQSSWPHEEADQTKAFNTLVPNGMDIL